MLNERLLCASHLDKGIAHHGPAVSRFLVTNGSTNGAACLRGLLIDWSISREFREIFVTSEFCSFARLSRRNFARCETGFEGPNLPKWPKFLSGGEGQFEFCCLTSSKYTFLGMKSGRARVEYPFSPYLLQKWVKSRILTWKWKGFFKKMGLF